MSELLPACVLVGNRVGACAHPVRFFASTSAGVSGSSIQCEASRSRRLRASCLPCSKVDKTLGTRSSISSSAERCVLVCAIDWKVGLKLFGMGDAGRRRIGDRLCSIILLRRFKFALTFQSS